MLVGVLEYETKQLLSHHIAVEGYYTLDLLNQKITALDLAYMETKDCSSTITATTVRSDHHKLKQKGKFRVTCVLYTVQYFITY